MSTGKVVFNNSSGSNFTKRRKIMKGVNPTNKAEIKQWNPGANVTETANRRAGFESMAGYPILNYVPATTYFFTSYKLRYLQYPILGTNNWERIGNSIFLKAFRFKGYIRVLNKLPCIFRWRIKLYRFNGIAPVAGAATTKSHVDNYMMLYKTNQVYYANQNALEDKGFCRHNFYKAFKDLPKKYDYSVKVIASGTIAPTSGKLEMSGGLNAGSSDSVFDFKSISMSDNEFGNIPIDVKVKLNDRIHWTTNRDATELSPDVFYAIALEDDLGVGVKLSLPTIGSGSLLSDANWTFTQDRLDSPVEFNFFIRGYFTDS